jgi:hypothetical protein
MWVRGFGVFSTAVLLSSGLVHSQESTLSPREEAGLDSRGWLSPAPLAWTQPETFNWSTSPIKLNAHEYGSYNSNILNAPRSSFLLPGETRGDYLLTTTIGASGKYNAWAQQIFGDASYSVINYRHNVGFDGHNYNLDGGVNWVATSRCQGQLMAATKQYQTPQEEQFGPGIETMRTSYATETGRCSIYQDISAVLNSAVTTQNRTALGTLTPQANSLNNNITAYVQGGLQYQWPSLDKLQFLTKFSETHFTNPSVVGVAEALNASALLNTHVVYYDVVYNRTISPMLNFNLSGGLAIINEQTAGQHSTSPPAIPTFALTVNWLPSPKWLFAINADRTVTPPVSVLGGTQVGDTENVSMTYFLTPKVSLVATFARNFLAGNQTTPIANNLTRALGGFGANTLLSATLKALYQVTPFTTASISYQKSDRTLTGENIPTDIVLFGLDYQPQ